ncbi:MAG: NUDIX hydrolase [Deltaproteobacteria bacterium]|nr:NUDIX hydrolase [Deltaproteobacteria bacterium]
MEPIWLEWARRLQALAQSGLTYSQSPFEIERYEQVREIASEMMAVGSGYDLARVRDLFAQEKGYATPKVDGRGVVFRDGRLLLVKELRDGCWTLPGGFADVGDTPAEAVVREVLEETGYEVKPIKLLALWDRNKQGHLPPRPFHIYKVFIRCEIVGGSPKSSHETAEPTFFASDEIPPLSLSRTTPAQISRLFEHYSNPGLPADFD